MVWPRYSLREVAPAIPTRNTLNPDDMVWHLGLDRIESHTGVVLGKHRAPISKAGNSTFHFDQSHVLYSKLRPYLNKVVVPDEPGITNSCVLGLLDDEEFEAFQRIEQVRESDFEPMVAPQLLTDMPS